MWIFFYTFVELQDNIMLCAKGVVEGGSHDVSKTIFF